MALLAGPRQADRERVARGHDRRDVAPSTEQLDVELDLTVSDPFPTTIVDPRVPLTLRR